MKAFFTHDKNLYYESLDSLNPLDIEVPLRPSADHVFINGSWVDKNFLSIPNANHQVGLSQHQLLAPALAPANQPNNLNDLVNVIRQLQTINSVNHQQDISNNTNKKDNAIGSFIGDKFTWKDLITILYFAGGIVGLWMHLNERIIVLEQKVVTIEKGNAELQSTFKEFSVKNENQLKTIDSKISDLQQMIISRASSK